MRAKGVEKRHVSQAEAEEVFFNKPLLTVLDTKHSASEPRIHALGRTDKGDVAKSAWHMTDDLRHRCSSKSGHPECKRDGEHMMTSAVDASHCEIRILAPKQLERATTVLANGMLDNPLHVAAFGDDPVRRHRRLKRFLGQLTAYVLANGWLLGAYVDEELVGVLGMMEPSRCRPGLVEKLSFAGVVIASNPPANAARIGRWLTAWARNDPDEPHWHIGPLAVVPTQRRQGLGRRLMSHCCARIDERSAPAYLETDLAINVAFYGTLGFEVVERQTVLGVQNWFMVRPPRAEAPYEASGSALGA